MSVIAALSMAPTLRRLGLCFLADPKHYITAETVERFLRELLRHLRGRVIVVWDGGSNHKGALIRALWCAPSPPASGTAARLRAGPQPGGVHLEPPQVRAAAQLSAREPCPTLDRTVRSQLQSVGQTPGLLKALWHGSKLPFPGTHLYLTEDQ